MHGAPIKIIVHLLVMVQNDKIKSIQQFGALRSDAP